MSLQPFALPGQLTAQALAGQTVPGALGVSGPLTVTGSVPAGSLGGPMMELVAATAIAGTALINGTQNILTWTAPNDGKLHRVMLLGVLHVTTAETGGATQLAYTSPDGGAAAVAVWGSGFGAGIFQPNLVPLVVVQAGSTVTFQQNAALTAGVAVVIVELWAS